MMDRRNRKLLKDSTKGLERIYAALARVRGGQELICALEPVRTNVSDAYKGIEALLSDAEQNQKGETE